MNEQSYPIAWNTLQVKTYRSLRYNVGVNGVMSILEYEGYFAVKYSDPGPGRNPLVPLHKKFLTAWTTENSNE